MNYRDRSFILEAMSILAFICMAIELILGFDYPKQLSSSFWACVFTFIGINQFLAMILRDTYPIYRVITSFVAGSIWTFLGISLLNTVLGIPILLLGLMNMLDFYCVSKNTAPELDRLIRENNADSYTTRTY